MILKNMNVFVKKVTLMEKEVQTLEFCEEYSHGKAHKIPFPKAKHVTTELLGHVHSDLWAQYLMKKAFLVASMKDEEHETISEWKHKQGRK